MEKVMSDWAINNCTSVKMSADEAKEICKLGEGESCCAFLVCGSTGFECVRMDYPINGTIFERLGKGEMNAKGRGLWKGCAWEKEEQA